MLVKYSVSKLAFFPSPSSSLYLKLSGHIQNENTHLPKLISAFSVTFSQIETNYKHVVLISNGLRVDTVLQYKRFKNWIPEYPQIQLETENMLLRCVSQEEISLIFSFSKAHLLSTSRMILLMN